MTSTIVMLRGERLRVRLCPSRSAAAANEAPGKQIAALRFLAHVRERELRRAH
ncbi:hypothetical protein [Sphingomonas sp. Ant20]|uniref:hypothetical protein n=1 Tax=Sphingomonas sp. Ant20 TaxID=104605 RepID=UPI0018E3527D|nr:hypothetical protein [Sphingomonas sp. Ant20]